MNISCTVGVAKQNANPNAPGVVQRSASADSSASCGTSIINFGITNYPFGAVMELSAVVCLALFLNNALNIFEGMQKSKKPTRTAEVSSAAPVI